MVEHFHRLFPDVAAREARSLDVQDNGKEGELPAGEYFFLESYCTEPGCPCERVLIDVADRRLGVIASISYDLEGASKPAFPDRPSPCLDPQSRQSKYAEQALASFKESILDEEYNERLWQHYRLVKSAVNFAHSRPDRHESGSPNQRGDWAKERRKQQKAARRKNRRR